MRAPLLVVAACAACGTPARPATEIASPVAGAPEAIVIGHYGSLTGANAPFGQATDHGIQLAVDEQNAAGGVRGAQVRLVSYDDAGHASEATVAVTRLIVDEHASAILGEVASSLSLAGGAAAQELGVPMITPSSTNPAVTAVGDMVFRACIADDFQGYAAARFAFASLGARRAIVLVDPSQAYSAGLAAAFEHHFADAGGTVAAELGYASGSFDLAALQEALDSSGADVVFLPGYYDDAAAILRAARAGGVAVPFVGGDGWDSDELVKIAGDAVDGSYYVNHFSALEDRPEVAAFVRAYQERFGAAPDALAALGYDAARLLLDAMQRARSLGGADLRDAIAATRDLRGVTGTLSMGPDHGVAKSAVVIGFAHGAATVAARIDPP